MTTYQQEAEILKFTHIAYEYAKVKQWVDVKINLSKAINIIDKL